ncbi:unnamed protein product, partial [Adineta ricciae]
MTSKPNPSPYYRASAWSRFFHSWVLLLLKTRREQKTLHLSNLYDLLPHLESTKLTERLEANWLDEIKQTNRQPSLVRATLRTLGWTPFFVGLLLIPNDIAKFAQPILLTYLMGFFESCSTMPAWHAWLYIVGIGLASLTSNVFYNQYFYRISTCGLQMRIAYSGLIYRKILRLSSRSMNGLSSGQITNLVSNDASQIELLFQFVHYTWAAPLEMIFVLGFFWGYVKHITFIAAGYTLTLLLVQVSFGRLFVYLRYAIRNLVYYLAAKKRIENFLLLDESERDNRLLSTSTVDLPTTEQNSTDIQPTRRKSLSIVCELNNASWEQDRNFELKNIVFHARPGDLICIIGPVGSGKSSLLQALSGEIPCFDGKVRLYGSFCYVPQEPWIFSSSIKENILFGKSFNHKLFQRVVNATALDIDFQNLTHGAHTLVGDQGVMLSGGQKARVNMARALYRDADIYLLDDPLSAVDARVSKHLFDKSIKSYLRKKICVLVTHQIQFLQDATKIIVLDNGEMVQIGTYTELLSSSASFARLLEDINQHRQEKEKPGVEETALLKSQLSKVNSVNSEKAEDEAEDLLSKPTNVEIKQEGIVKWSVYASYLRAGIGLVIGLLVIMTMFSLQQAAALYSSWWLAGWSDAETQRHLVFNNCSTFIDEKAKTIRGMDNNQWTNYRNGRFYTYCGIVIVLVSITMVRVIITEFICLNAGRVLHNKMFRRLIRSPIYFFDMNPVGRILNRFTKDVAVLDDNLPLTMFDFLQCLFQALGFVVLIGILNPWAFIPALFAGVGMLFIRYHFARCLRDLKRIEGVTRSPIYSQLSSTIYGVKVIRSYHAEKIAHNEFHRHMDDNTRVNYLLLTMNRWVAIRFDWIAFAFISIVTILAMVVRLTQQAFSAADIALTLSFGLNLMGLVQWTIRQSVEVETQMTAVERVLEYCALEQEPPAQLPPHLPSPPSNWPTHGRI